MAKAELDSVEEDQEIETPEEVDDESQDESEGDDEDQDLTEETEETTTEEESDESDEDETEDESETFEKRFTQFKGDDLSEYTKNLEEGYAQSYGEINRVKKELTDYKQKVDSITAMVANDPELAEKLNVKDSSPDPALNYARQEMEAKMKTEYDGFLKDHPEVESDPTLGEKLVKRLASISKAVSEEEGRMIGMGEGLEMAWNSLGLGSNTQEITRMAAKNVAAQSKTTSSKKQTPKSNLTPSQLEIGKKLGLSEKDLQAQVK